MRDNDYGMDAMDFVSPMIITQPQKWVTPAGMMNPYSPTYMFKKDKHQTEAVVCVEQKSVYNHQSTNSEGSFIFCILLVCIVVAIILKNIFFK